MPTDLTPPDLLVSLDLNEFTPRAARHHVRGVDHPSPDLRDAVALLTGELVIRAVAHSGDSAEALELRVWMPADVVRVELRTRADVLPPARVGDSLKYGEMLLRQIAHRWSIDTVAESSCMWFEIDRQPPGGDDRADGWGTGAAL